MEKRLYYTLNYYILYINSDNPQKQKEMYIIHQW